MKESLIGINEGIEELTLTLLIGIKADLLLFILYSDRLLKLSNFSSLSVLQAILLETVLQEDSPPFQ